MVVLDTDRVLDLDDLPPELMEEGDPQLTIRPAVRSAPPLRPQPRLKVALAIRI